MQNIFKTDENIKTSVTMIKAAHVLRCCDKKQHTCFLDLW